IYAGLRYGMLISGGAAAGLQHVGHALDLRQHVAELRGALDFHRHVEGGDMVMRADADIAHIDPLFGDSCTDVAHQALTVIGIDDHRHRVARFLGVTPIDCYQPLLIGQVEDIAAVLAVDRHAAPPRDIADDLFTLKRITAARQGGQQPTRPVNADTRRERGGPRLCDGGEEGRLVLNAFAFDFQNFGRNLLRMNIAKADLRQKILGLVNAEKLGYLIVRRLLDAKTLQLTIQHLAAQGDHLLTVLLAEPLANLGDGALGADKAQIGVEPVAAWPAALGGQNLHPVADLKPIIQRDELPVHLGAPAAVAEVGVDVIGEVNGRGACREVDNIAARGEDIDAILEYFGPHDIHELARIVNGAAHFHQIAEMLHTALEGFIALAARLLVAPMRGDTVFGMLVHLLGANLDFEGLPIFEDDGGVQGLVKIIFGCGDVIVEFARNRTPGLVDHAQRLITGRQIIDNDAHGTDIKQLVKGDALALHLLPDAVNMLGASRDFRLDAKLFEDRLQPRHEMIDIVITVGAALVDQTSKIGRH